MKIVNKEVLNKTTRIISILALLLTLFTLISCTGTEYRSYFQIKQQAEPISAKQISIVFDRVVVYYGYSCKTGCKTYLRRKYISTYGSITYSYNSSRRKITIKHLVLRADGLFFNFVLRNDVKHMQKVRRNILNQLRELGSDIKVSIQSRPKAIRVRIWQHSTRYLD